MPWLVDGSNVLGAMRADRHSDDAKRELVRRLAAFARSRRTRVTCIFDGEEPPSFARHLGAVTVVFSGARAADELIIARADGGRGWSVVTSDQALAARVRRRHVSVVGSQSFIRDLETAAAESGGETGEDWDSWFADDKNRLKF